MTSAAGRHIAWLFALLVLVSALPVWVFPHLPSQDLPTHLVVLDALARDEEPGWDDRFEDRRAWRPYKAVYGAAAPIAAAIGAERTGRLLLTLYAVLLPLSLAAILRVHRPGSEAAALLAIPLVYSDVYLLGFLPYLLSLPLLLLAVALGLATLRGGSRLVLSAIGLALCTLLACLAHPFAMALFAVLAATWLVFCAASPRALVAFGAACAPAAAVLASWLVDNPAPASRHIAASYKLSYLLTTPAFALDAGRLVEAPIVLGLVGALAVAIVLGALRDPTRRASFASVLGVARAGWLGLLALVVLYWTMPFARDQAVWVDLRLAPVAWLMLIVCAAPAVVATRLRLALAVGLVAIALVGVARVHAAFSEEAAPLFRLIARVPSGARILPLLIDRRSRVLEPSYERSGVVPFASPYAHMASWYHLQKGGESPFMAFHHSMRMLPLALRSEFYRHRFAVGEIFAPQKTLARLPSLARRFDFALVRADSLTGLAAIDEVATLFAAEPPFYAFAFER